MTRSIVEAVDSICRASADTQFMTLQKKISPNLKNSKLINVYNNMPSSVFMATRSLVVWKSITKVPKQKAQK